jgi:hypothetical protein
MMRNVTIVTLLIGCLCSCQPHPKRTESGVFGRHGLQLVVAALSAPTNKVLLAWATETGIKERVLTKPIVRRRVANWFMDNADLLNSIPPPSDQYNSEARRPRWEMSIFSGSNAWDETRGALRLDIDDSKALSQPAFVELMRWFEENGTKPEGAGDSQ